MALHKVEFWVERGQLGSSESDRDMYMLCEEACALLNKKDLSRRARVVKRDTGTKQRPLFQMFYIFADIEAQSYVDALRVVEDACALAWYWTNTGD